MASLLDTFDRHKYGIIGTLLIHTAVVFSLAISSLRSHPTENERSELRVDVAPPMTEEEFKQLEEALQRNEDPRPLLKVQNAVNNPADEERIKEATRIDPRTQERISDRVFNDLKRMEQEEFERLAEERRERGEDVTIPELDTSRWNKDRYMERKPPPSRKDLPVAVEHDLKPRTLDIRVPMYLCPGSGRVAISVSVARDGRILQSKVDPDHSSTSDPCTVEYALARTGEAHFSRAPDAPEPQRGTITFIFVPQ